MTVCRFKTMEKEAKTFLIGDVDTGNSFMLTTDSYDDYSATESINFSTKKRSQLKRYRYYDSSSRITCVGFHIFSSKASFIDSAITYNQNKIEMLKNAWLTNQEKCFSIIEKLNNEK